VIKHDFFTPEIIAKHTSDQVLTFIDISAISIGVHANFSFYLISISNACSGIGQFPTRLVVDKLGSIVPSTNPYYAYFFYTSAGAINMIVPIMSVAAIVTYVGPFV
jgi:MCP family monocarboxylic acid transporter-like MFS transporter 10